MKFNAFALLVIPVVVVVSVQGKTGNNFGEKLEGLRNEFVKHHPEGERVAKLFSQCEQSEPDTDGIY